MDSFDKKIKNNLNEHLTGHIHFSNTEKYQVMESVKKKRIPFFILSLTSIAVTCIILVLSTIPFWRETPSNEILKQTISPISKTTLSMKEKLPESFFLVRDSEEQMISKDDEESQNDQIEERTEETEDKSKDSNNEQVEEDKNDSNNEDTESGKKAENTDNQTNDNEKDIKSGAEEKESDEENQQEEEVANDAVDQDVFINLVKKYNNMHIELVENTEEDPVPDYNRAKNFNSKDEYFKHLSQFMTYETAADVWKGFFKEEGGHLWVLARDGHPDFVLDYEYSVKKISDTEYFMYQINQSQLFTGGNFEIYFSKIDGNWMISKVVY
ncbi:hypothetical protein MUN88_10885 [Gracilibacillus caseinilyticus]|uniref:Uncharacterized protein n=1 Tax=Gracilibacillus caseinilyticus TaxID=2932256 RepID=A0ABY4EQ97_9BACI|nr:hypothetical protein [Gracilibacillus caseinilyticus]UOQ46612.1 hypothetical protein MUN88_10885 [Gracilibacillus caseinilyticus]